MVRVFIAIEIEDPQTLRRIIEVRDRVLACSKEIKMKGVEDENIHLTLRFIGEIPESMVEDIKKCIDLCSSVSSFKMRIRGLGAFPSPSRPRVIWVGVEEGEDKLKKLWNLVEGCLSKLVKPDRRGFVPHITIARVKVFRKSKCLASLISELQDLDLGESQITRVKLKKSTLTPKGPIYTDLAEVLLRGAESD